MNTLQRRFAVALLCILPSLSYGQNNPPSQTQPTTLSPPIPPDDVNVAEWKHQQFKRFDPHFDDDLAQRIARLRVLSANVIQREVAQQNTQYSHEILSELIWLISSTADFKRMDQRMDELQSMPDHPNLEDQAEKQDPADGSWGRGYSAWFFKVVATYAQTNTLSNKNAKPQYDLALLDRVNSPQKLTDYFNSVFVSDISRTGVDNEREMNESLSTILRMILRQKPKGYVWNAGLKDTMMDLVLHRLRNPNTGFWGERYVDGAQTRFVDDLSMTFHMVSYLDGNVPDWDKIIDTTLAVKDQDFPAGWLFKGQLTNHLNMDLAELFRLGWPHASDSQKKAMAAQLDRLVHWCLAESMEPDGSFKFFIGDNSQEEGTYYGASFLSRIGYFDKSKRFWTDQDFPDAESVRQRIISYIQNHIKSAPTGGDYYQSALEQLNDQSQPNTVGK
jgi:hypothetical protein